MSDFTQDEMTVIRWAFLNAAKDAEAESRGMPFTSWGFETFSIPGHILDYALHRVAWTIRDDILPARNQSPEQEEQP